MRAIVRTQKALKADPALATAIGNRLFPPEEASPISSLVARDAPFYDAMVTSGAVDGSNKFAKASGLIAEPAPYERLVASQFRPIWNGWRRAYFFTGAAGLSMGLGGAVAGAAG